MGIAGEHIDGIVFGNLLEMNDVLEIPASRRRFLTIVLPVHWLGEMRPSYTLPCGLVSEVKLTRCSIDQELAKGKLLFYTVVDLDTLIAVNSKKW